LRNIYAYEPSGTHDHPPAELPKPINSQRPTSAKSAKAPSFSPRKDPTPHNLSTSSNPANPKENLKAPFRLNQESDGGRPESAPSQLPRPNRRGHAPGGDHRRRGAEAGRRDGNLRQSDRGRGDLGRRAVRGGGRATQAERAGSLNLSGAGRCPVGSLTGGS
jgi:hypothetical protein